MSEWDIWSGAPLTPQWSGRRFSQGDPDAAHYRAQEQRQVRRDQLAKAAALPKAEDRPTVPQRDPRDELIEATRALARAKALKNTNHQKLQRVADAQHRLDTARAAITCPGTEVG